MQYEFKWCQHIGKFATHTMQQVGVSFFTCLYPTPYSLHKMLSWLEYWHATICKAPLLVYDGSGILQFHLYVQGSDCDHQRCAKDCVSINNWRRFAIPPQGSNAIHLHVVLPGNSPFFWFGEARGSHNTGNMKHIDKRIAIYGILYDVATLSVVIIHDRRYVCTMSFSE